MKPYKTIFGAIWNYLRLFKTTWISLFMAISSKLSMSFPVNFGSCRLPFMCPMWVRWRVWMRNLAKIDKRTLARRFCLKTCRFFAASNFRLMILCWFVGEVLCQPFGSKSSRPGSWNWPKVFFPCVHFRLSLGDHNHVHNAIIMLGRNDACQQNVVLFELVEEIVFDVEALSMNLLFACWAMACSNVMLALLISQGPALPEGISSVAWTSDLIDWRNGVSMGSIVTGLCGARPSDCWFNGKGRALDAKGLPKTESTWMREAVHWSPFFLHFLEAIIESFFCNFVVGRPTDLGKKYKVQFDYLIVSSPYLWRFVVRIMTLHQVIQ